MVMESPAAIVPVRFSVAVGAVATAPFAKSRTEQFIAARSIGDVSGFEISTALLKDEPSMYLLKKSDSVLQRWPQPFEASPPHWTLPHEGVHGHLPHRDKTVPHPPLTGLLTQTGGTQTFGNGKP